MKLSETIRSNMLGIQTPVTDDELVEKIISDMPVFDIQALLKKQIIAGIRSVRKNEEPKLSSKQQKFWTEEELEIPFRTEDKKTVRLGSTSGGDLMEKSRRNHDNARNAYESATLFDNNYFPVMEEMFRKNLPFEDAINLMGRNSIVSDKEEEA